MPADFITIHPENPENRFINQVVDALNKGKLVILPTDTIYGLACPLTNKKGIAQICKLLGKKPQKANLSLLCADFRDISEYTKSFDNTVFKLMRQTLPGPYTYILNASNKIPKLFNTNKKTVGIRVPDNEILQSVLCELDVPLVSSSIHSEDEILDYITSPDDMLAEWQHKVSIIVDGGAGGNIGSTVIDCTGREPELIREGAGFEAIAEQIFS